MAPPAASSGTGASACATLPVDAASPSASCPPWRPSRLLSRTRTPARGTCRLKQTQFSCHQSCSHLIQELIGWSRYGTRAKWLKLTSPVGACVSVPCESGVSADDSEHSPLFRTVSVWGDQVRAEDCGEAAAAFLVKTLGRDGLRLVRFADSRPSAELGDRAPTVTGPGFAGPRKPIYGTAFSDQYQFTLASTASLASLNNRIARRDVRRVYSTQ